MANIKSQKKRALTNRKSQLANASKRTAVKTAIKNVQKAIEAKDKEAAAAAFSKANSVLDKALVDGIKTKNYVARQKSRLAKAVNSIEG
ncbi:MAG: 30S ribosomal protein S20 [Solobacterium sp.]|nr:30S ribosomal protein S20 [Solobacterium sp.]